MGMWYGVAIFQLTVTYCYRYSYWNAEVTGGRWHATCKLQGGCSTGLVNVYSSRTTNRSE